MTGLMTTMRAQNSDPRHLARHQVMGLTVQFALGTAVGLLGQPSQAKGTARIVSSVLLAAHILLTVGLIIGAILLIRAAASMPSPPRQLAAWGAAAVAVSTAAGVLTMVTKSNW